MTPEITTYLRQILIDAGQTGLDPAIEDQMLIDLQARLEDRLILTAMQQLEPKKQMELTQMADSIKDTGVRKATVEKFLKDNIKNYNEVFTNALLDFRNLYVEASKK